MEYRAESKTATRYAKYTPRPDAMFTRDDFPYFLCEIDSHVNREDMYRLYVQMACALRLGLRIFNVQAPYRFFIMGAYLTSQWEIFRLFAYVEDDKVCKEELFKDAPPMTDSKPRSSLQSKPIT